MPKFDSLLIRLITKSTISAEGYQLKYMDEFPGFRYYSFIGLHTNYYFRESEIVIQDSLSGNLLIESKSRITIRESARLQDVILKAPVIHFEKNFLGNVQCFANQMIEIDSGSEFEYPSALVLAGGEQDSLIWLKNDVKFSGVIVLPGHDATIGSRGVFRLDTGALMQGSAYVNGSADIQGKVLGHLTTRRFQAMIESTSYGNHLYNAVIDGTQAEIYKSASFLWGNSDQVVIAKWLE
jgi:hypothetical protein